MLTTWEEKKKGADVRNATKAWYKDVLKKFIIKYCDQTISGKRQKHA